MTSGVHLARAAIRREAVVFSFVLELRMLADACKKFLYGCVLRCRRIQEDGPSLMLFDRHRSTASDGFTAARNERCQFTHAPGLANQAMPHARLKVSCGRNWFWAAARASAARRFPRATP